MEDWKIGRLVYLFYGGGRSCANESEVQIRVVVDEKDNKLTKKSTNLSIIEPSNPPNRKAVQEKKGRNMLLKPDYNLKNIYDIDLKELKDRGIKAIFFDLDSTIMVSKSGKYDEKTQKWLKEVEKDFFIAVVTNNKSIAYVEKVKSVSTFTVISDAKKPRVGAMKKLLRQICMTPTQIVMVGDRPLTDILAGKLLGAKTILVGSINAENEGVPTRFVRWLERLFIRK